MIFLDAIAKSQGQTGCGSGPNDHLFRERTKMLVSVRTFVGNDFADSCFTGSIPFVNSWLSRALCWNWMETALMRITSWGTPTQSTPGPSHWMRKESARIHRSTQTMSPLAIISSGFWPAAMLVLLLPRTCTLRCSEAAWKGTAGEENLPQLDAITLLFWLAADLWCRNFTRIFLEFHHICSLKIEPLAAELRTKI